MSTPEVNQAQQIPAAPAVIPPAPALPSPVRRVSPGLALFLSFFPGLGHLYLGMYRRGIAVFAAFAVAILLADHSDLGILIPFVVLFALVDAYRQAHFINSGVPVEVDSSNLATASQRKSSLGIGVFLVVLGLVVQYWKANPRAFEFLQEWWPMLLVLGGLYFVGAHFWDRKKEQERTGAEAL